MPYLDFIVRFSVKKITKMLAPRPIHILAPEHDLVFALDMKVYVNK